MTDHKTVKQCKSCPWRVDCDPDTDIPGGYSRELHRKLANTISDGSFRPGPIQAMACHYSQPGRETLCAGWLANQAGPGNNMAVRLAMCTGRYPVPELDGEQHERFEDTLPARSPRKAKRKR